MREREREREKRERESSLCNYVPCEPASKHERSTRRQQYERRVRKVEGGSFVPLVFSTAGGMGPACTTTLRRLASMLSGKFDRELCCREREWGR